MHLRTWQHQMTTIMQPFQCDLQPQIQETHRTTHTGTTTRCRTQRRNRFDARNDPSRNRRTHEVPFIAGCSHFTRKNTRFRAPASSPKQSPCNIHAAITMRFAASRQQPCTCIYAHGNTRWQQSSQPLPMRSATTQETIELPFRSPLPCSHTLPFVIWPRKRSTPQPFVTQVPSLPLAVL